ncbi:hypothetical protein EI534_12255 [Pseudomonas frederiksbergensis]|nr:hypothetical protein [Pseudomonas frederiksbergensis]
MGTSRKYRCAPNTQRFCGEGACSRLSAQHSQNLQMLAEFWGRFAARREQARSPQDSVRPAVFWARD